MEMTKERDWVRQYLTVDELSYGRANRNPEVLTKQDAFLIPFSLLWCGFAIFGEMTAWVTHASFLYCNIGVSFVLVGLYLVFGRFIVERRRISQTAYAITNKRILISQRGHLDVLDRNIMPSLPLDAGRDGKGTITFGDSLNTLSSSSTLFSQNKGTALQLKNIADVDRVGSVLMDQS